MTFGEALALLKAGNRVRHSTWALTDYVEVINGAMFKRQTMNLNGKQYNVSYFWECDKGNWELLEGNWEVHS